MELYTPFYDKHLEYGAKMQSVKDWKMPSFYTSIDEEYRMVRQSAAFVDYSFQSALSITGSESFDFLQKVLVNDLNKIKPGRAIYSTILERNGKIIDDTIVFWIRDDYYIINGSPNPKKQRLIDFLEEYSTGFDVEIMDLNTCFLALQGPKSREILQKAIDVSKMPYMSVRKDKLGDIPIVLARAGYSGELGFEMYIYPEYANRLWDKLVQLGKDYDVCPYGIGATALLSLEKGYLAPPDFYPGATPLELGLEWTVAFNKGFIGKEELLKRKQEGLKTKLIGFEVEDYFITAAPGTQLFRDIRPVGKVTYKNSYCPSIDRNVGRCWMETKYANIGEELDIEFMGERKKVKLVNHRHYDPENKKMKN